MGCEVAFTSVLFCGAIWYYRRRSRGCVSKICHWSGRLCGRRLYCNQSIEHFRLTIGSFSVAALYHWRCYRNIAPNLDIWLGPDFRFIFCRSFADCSNCESEPTDRILDVRCPSGLWNSDPIYSFLESSVGAGGKPMTWLLNPPIKTDLVGIGIPPSLYSQFDQIAGALCRVDNPDCFDLLCFLSFFLVISKTIYNS